jgi:hypothetical protein
VLDPGVRAGQGFRRGQRRARSHEKCRTMGILHTFRDLNYRGQGRTTLISHREVSLFGNSSAEYALSRCLRLVRIDHPAGDCGSLSSVECRTLLANPSIRQEGMAGTVIGVKRVHFAGSRAHQA